MLVNDYLYHVDELLKALQDGAEVRALMDSPEWSTLDTDARAEKEQAQQQVQRPVCRTHTHTHTRAFSRSVQ